ERGLRHRGHLAVDLHRRREARGDEEVRALLRDQRAQQVVDELGCLFAFHFYPAKLSLLAALPRASAIEMMFLCTSSCKFWSSVCMPIWRPVWIAEYICAILFSRIRLRIAGVPIMISWAAQRPAPSLVFSMVCEVTAR